MPVDPLLVFPASDAGFLAQFPVEYESQRRGPHNVFRGGAAIFSPAESRLKSRWALSFGHLSNGERDRMEEFLALAEGEGKSFLFFDPLGNLLQHSMDLENPVWVRSGAVDVAAFEDPQLGAAFVLTNSGTGWGSLEQTISFGHGFLGCFSLGLKWDSPVQVRLRIADADGQSELATSAMESRRAAIKRKAAATVASSTVSIQLAPNSQIIVAAPQLEIGAQASAYFPTGQRSGVVEKAYLRQDSYRWTSLAPHAHRLELIVESDRS
jgi:hypothetical protein